MHLADALEAAVVAAALVTEPRQNPAIDRAMADRA